MDKPTYNLKTSSDKLRYFFESQGLTTIQKAIIYIPIDNNPTVHELTFGDIIDDGFVDFLNVSNNQDLEMIMITVIKTISLYFEEYPDNMIYFRGSTPSRTRLYRAIIAKQIDKLKLSHQVYGLQEENHLEIFDKTHSYIGYLIQKLHEKEN